MKITYKGDYALKAVLDLAMHYESGRVVPLSEIAGRQDIPMHYLEQIMLIIKGAGYVISKRGFGYFRRYHAKNKGAQRTKYRLYVSNLEE